MCARRSSPPVVRRSWRRLGRVVGPSRMFDATVTHGKTAIDNGIARRAHGTSPISTSRTLFRARSLASVRREHLCCSVSSP